MVETKISRTTQIAKRDVRGFQLLDGVMYGLGIISADHVLDTFGAARARWTSLLNLDQPGRYSRGWVCMVSLIQNL